MKLIDYTKRGKHLPPIESSIYDSTNEIVHNKTILYSQNRKLSPRTKEDEAYREKGIFESLPLMQSFSGEESSEGLSIDKSKDSNNEDGEERIDFLLRIPPRKQRQSKKSDLRTRFVKRDSLTLVRKGSIQSILDSPKREQKIYSYFSEFL